MQHHAQDAVDAEPGYQRRASEYDVVMISEVREIRQRRDEVRPRHLSVRECLEGPAAPLLGLLPGRSGRDIQNGW
jgi:hypothetical protein